ncbi:MAG: hypothetical protein CMM52_01835 [Rhodospirillaceae bacterium]|nr:hypothetical protein [Rhodospirillaceae bacterium]
MKLLRKHMLNVAALCVGLIVGLILYVGYDRHFLVVICMPFIALGVLYIIRNPLNAFLEYISHR